MAYCVACGEVRTATAPGCRQCGAQFPAAHNETVLVFGYAAMPLEDRATTARAIPSPGSSTIERDVEAEVHDGITFAGLTDVDSGPMSRAPVGNAKTEGRKATPVQATEQRPEPALKEGIAERYELMDRIAAGGMGAIYLAQERLSKRFVALKVVSDAAAAPKPLVHQFILEAIVTARLQHPNIVPVYDLGFFTEGHLYYTMRFVDGQTLAKRHGGLDLPERLRVLRSVASAVRFAHAQGLWHRDLKPDNVLIGPHGDTYVIDWGLVTPIDGANYELQIPSIILRGREAVLNDDVFDRTPERATNMGPNNLLGTLAYMAPEHFLLPTKLGPQADIWALGVMLYEALTDAHPLAEYGLRNDFQYASHWAQRSELKRASEVRADIPPALSDLCSSMLQLSTSDRVSNVSDVIDGLDAHLGGPSTVARLVSTPPLRPEATALQQREMLELSGQHVELQKRLALLSAERDRLLEKTEILTEITQTGFFQAGKRRELLAKLMRL